MSRLGMGQRRERKRANLRDVARTAGVSVATVSRVLNTPEVVHKDTRSRVQAVIAELGFHPSAAARAINSGRTKIIGALIPNIDNDIFALTIDAIESRLGDFGFSLVVATTGEDPEKETRRAKELLDIGVEGLFLSGVTHNSALLELIEHTRVPAIVTSYFDADFTYPTIGYDNQKAAKIALDHLLELGHRQIAVVHGPTEHNDRTRARIAGTATSRDDVSLSYFEAELSVSGGAATAAQVLLEGRAFDAYLCVTDVLAFGVMAELQRGGFSIPNDVSVIGVHDLPSAKSTFPRLSTVSLPAREMGHRAAEALAKWVEEEIKPQSICLDTELKARESTAAKSDSPAIVAPKRTSGADN